MIVTGATRQPIQVAAPVAKDPLEACRTALRTRDSSRTATPCAAAPPPSAPPLAAVRAAGAAPTPQAAMDLWKQYRGPTAINEGMCQVKTATKAAAGFAQSLAEQE